MGGGGGVKPRLIALGPYPGHVIFTRCKGEFHRIYRTYVKADYTERMGEGVTVFLRHSKSHGRLYLIYYNTQATLAHETAHLIFDLFKHVGIDPREGDNEPFCYMLSHLMESAKK